MKTTTKSLEQKIESAVEQLVREHLAACEAAAAAAVRAAFGRASKSSSKSRRRKSPSKSSRRKSSRAQAPRRSREELAALEERLYEAIRRHPGETMAVIAPAAEATARALNRPATTLRQQGRVRSVGRRQYTRYFPMGE
jgi:hypothetical protein